MPILTSRAGFLSGKFAGGKVPDVPTLVTSVRQNQALNISGTPPDFNGGLAISDYEYALSTNSGSTYGSWISSGSAIFPFQIPNLTNGQAYYVKIRAVNALGGGNEFGPITTGVTPSTIPNAPTNVSGTNYADSQSVVSWTAPADNGAAITGYKVEYAPGPLYTTFTTFNADTGTTATSITVTSLSNGTYYKFRISAINVAGTGSTGTSVSAFLPAVIPGVPTSPEISSGSGSITIQWGAPVSDGGAPPVTYYVETQKDSDAWVDRGVQTSPYAITGLPNDGSTYRARILASTVVGSSATKATTGDTVPSAVPAAPIFLSASSGSGTYYIAWTAPANNGAAITSYTVQLTTPNQTAWDATKIVTGVTAGDYTFSGLDNGFSYRARVLAVNTRGSGPYMDPHPSGQQTPSTTPGTPTFRGASAGDRTYTLQWNAPANGGAAIDYYEVQITNANQIVWSTVYSPNPTGTEVTFGGLLNGNSYRAQVRAHNVRGFGPWFDDQAQTARTPDMIVPTISWEDTSATKYNLFRAYYTGNTSYTYQTQLYPADLSGWGDYGTTETGSGTKYTPYYNPSYQTTFYFRVKVSDPNGRVKYTNQIYVTNGRAANAVIDRAANTVVDVAGYYTNSAVKTSSGFSIFNNTANGANGGTFGFESPYPISLSSSDYGFTGFRILMQKYDSGTYDLTSSTRRVYVYGPAGIGMALYSGATAGQTWGDGVASSTRWTGTGDVGYTWNVNSGTAGAVNEGGYIVWGDKDEIVLQPHSDANPTTNYSTQWGATVRTKVTVYVYYRTRTYTATTYLPQTYLAQVNSVYG